MVLGFVGCKNNDDDKTTPAPHNTNKPAESVVPETLVPNTPLPTGDYNAMSAAIYDAQLGAFNTLYQAAKEETNVSKRYALMAQAEAKLLEAAVLIPGTTNGGNYGLSVLQSVPLPPFFGAMTPTVSTMFSSPPSSLPQRIRLTSRQCGMRFAEPAPTPRKQPIT